MVEMIGSGDLEGVVGPVGIVREVIVGAMQVTARIPEAAPLDSSHQSSAGALAVDEALLPPELSRRSSLLNC